jgi:hypothetical protein
MLSAHPEPQLYGTHASTEDYGGSCPITDILRVLWRRFALTCNESSGVSCENNDTLGSFGGQASVFSGAKGCRFESCREY